MLGMSHSAGTGYAISVQHRRTDWGGSGSALFQSPILTAAQFPAYCSRRYSLQKSSSYQHYMDNEVAIPRKKIYRDQWERQPYTKDELFMLARRPPGEIDYPKVLDEVRRIHEQLGFPLPKEVLFPSPIVDR